MYGLDIETDTTVDGLDPDVAAVVTVALSDNGRDEVFTGDETSILLELDALLSDLEPGIIATWNGAAFDLPFLADRAARNGLPLGLRLRPDPKIRLDHEPLPGHECAYRARWHRHGHVDAYRLYLADVGPALRVSCSLKSIGGLDDQRRHTCPFNEATPTIRCAKQA